MVTLTLFKHCSSPDSTTFSSTPFWYYEHHAFQSYIGFACFSFGKKRREITHRRSFASLEKRLYERVESEKRAIKKKWAGAYGEGEKRRNFSK